MFKNLSETNPQTGDKAIKMINKRLYWYAILSNFNLLTVIIN